MSPFPSQQKVLSKLFVKSRQSWSLLRLRVVGDISGDELEVSARELVVILAVDGGRAPLALSVGGRGQLGVQSATGTILRIQLQNLVTKYFSPESVRKYIG